MGIIVILSSIMDKNQQHKLPSSIKKGMLPHPFPVSKKNGFD